LKVLGILTVTLLFLFLWQSRSTAQTATQLESRLSRLEFENNALQTSLNQLEAQVSRLSSSAGLDFSLSEAPAGRTPAAAAALADDPTFKRLATLVIELKERVVAVEERISGDSGR
jgi:hypothetical protein